MGRCARVGKRMEEDRGSVFIGEGEAAYFTANDVGGVGGERGGFKLNLAPHGRVRGAGRRGHERQRGCGRGRSGKGGNGGCRRLEEEDGADRWAHLSVTRREEGGGGSAQPRGLRGSKGK
uniref:Uncharacterized protein n=1 Tax=Oryza sativa subsp. japonica TaxID=39947 RepID=Q654H8_ORYSJ|nr:hypothetical protein [Oryza sativa Japonica Group]